MNDRRLVAGIAAVALVAVVMVAWVLLSPGWAVRAIDEAAQAQLGRRFAATGGAHLDFSPLAIRIDGPSLSGLSPEADSLMKAKSLAIPVTLGQLIGRKPDLSQLQLEEPEFALLIDERGKASWDFPEGQPGGGLRFTLQQGSFRYFDVRNSQALAITNVDGQMSVSGDGAVSFEGSAVLNAHVARIALDLKSLPRINQDGSPLELAIETEAASASFSGRIATAKVLSLAGPVSLSSRDTEDVAHWAGLPLAQGTTLPGPLNIDGALDSAGRAYAIRNAAITLGQFRGAGDLVADLRGERTKIQAALQADTVWLDALVPDAGEGPGSWGRAKLPAQLLKSLDAELNILARAAAYGTFSAGPSRLAATLKDGKLDASGAFRLDGEGTASFAAHVDAAVLPPQGTLSLKAEKASLEPVATALTGITALTGTGDFSAELSAQGSTQEELVSTLKGTASLTLANGRLAGTDLGGILGAVSSRILEGWNAAPGGTPLTEATASVTLADGVATITSAELATPAFRLALTGVADLLRRAVDVKAAMQPPETAPLPVPVVVKGGWDKPRFYPDIPDILTNPEGGFARLRSQTPPGN